MKICTAEEIKDLDKKAVSNFKIPSLLLMENAARGLVDQIEAHCGSVTGKRIVILCGSGNNGGDGMGAARHLRMRGAEAIVYLLSPIDKISGDAKTMLDTWIATGGSLHVIGSFSFKELAKTISTCHLVIDALLGTGLSHPVHGHYVKAIETIKHARVPVISVDIPSGISADTGEMLGIAVRANYTFTMGLPKRGLFLRDGLEHRGTWDVVDIGFPKELVAQGNIKVNLVNPADLKGFTPSRRLGAHKGDFGHLLIIGGSKGKSGAPAMAALAALRSGTGLVTVALPKSIDSIASTVMEAMTLPSPETDNGTLSLQSEKMLLKAIEEKEAVAIGPGLSQDHETVQLVISLIPHITAPMVIDADGINALATNLSVLKKKKGPVILTPHPGEMGRLLGISSAAVQKDRIEIASAFSIKWDVIVVLKGAHTVIATPEANVFLSNTGNPGMATGGTGDALTGIIGAGLAQGIAPTDAAIWGVVLHGLAGDLAKETQGEISLITSDLIAKIPEAMRVVF